MENPKEGKMKARTRFQVTILIPLFAFVFAGSAWAIPPQINFQGKLTDSGGAPVDDPGVNMTFTLWSDAASEDVSDLIWSESQLVEVTDGIYNVLLGSSTAFPEGIDWGGNDLWLGITVSGETLDPRIKLSATPVSLWAKDADTVDGHDSTDFLSSSGGILTGFFHVESDDGVLFGGTHGSGNIPAADGGIRMMWYPAKGAFRAGGVTSSQWNESNIGELSTALGYNTTAAGSYSTAIGNSTAAFGYDATAMGSSTNANGGYSTALGHGTTAGSFGEIAIGSYNTLAAEPDLWTWVETDRLLTIGNGADAENLSTAMVVLKNGNVGIGEDHPASNLVVAGEDGVLFGGQLGTGSIPATGVGTRMMWYPAKAAFRAGGVSSSQWNDSGIGEYSAALGYDTVAAGRYSMSIGDNANAHAYNSMALGSFVTANGGYSTAIGRGTTTGSFMETAIGSFNTLAADPNLWTWVETDRLLTIGNGADADNPSTAMVVLKNGSVGIGTSSPGFFLVTEHSQDHGSLVHFHNTSLDPDADGIKITTGPSENPGDTNNFISMFDGDNTMIGQIEGDGAGGINFIETSDARLKTNIADFTGGLELIARMKPRTYSFKSAPEKTNIGFIAQELMEVFPPAVSGDPEGDVNVEPMGVDYSSLTPLLVAAIQELKAQNDALKAIVCSDHPDANLCN
jgi:hypothetical protein